MKQLKFNDWIITENAGSDFYACNGLHSIHFTAEYKNGIYFNVSNYYDIHLNRCYTASRYLIKIIPLVGEMTFELLKNGWLWDYKNNVPALETYKKDIAPYYKKCMEKGISLYDDIDFLNDLLKYA